MSKNWIVATTGLVVLFLLAIATGSATAGKDVGGGKCAGACEKAATPDPAGGPVSRTEIDARDFQLENLAFAQETKSCKDLGEKCRSNSDCCSKICGTLSSPGGNHKCGSKR